MRKPARWWGMRVLRPYRVGCPPPPILAAPALLRDTRPGPPVPPGGKETLRPPGHLSPSCFRSSSECRFAHLETHYSGSRTEFGNEEEEADRGNDQGPQGPVRDCPERAPPCGAPARSSFAVEGGPPCSPPTSS